MNTSELNGQSTELIGSSTLPNANNIKKIVCLYVVLIVLGMGTAAAQFSRPVSVGLGAGIIQGYTDLTNNGVKIACYGDLDYVASPFISIGLHAEKGKLGGHDNSNDFQNNYYVGSLNGKVRLGKFMRLPLNYSYYTLLASTLSLILANIYVGTGAGLMKNRIQRHLAADYTERIITSSGEIPRDPSGMYMIIPLNIGVDIPFGRTLYGPQWALNVNYQHTLTMDDNLDGIVNQKNDHYSLLSIGVKYAFFNRK